MSKDAVATMGTILTPDVGGRDAVHVAVIAVKAATTIMPGAHICLAMRHLDKDEYVAWNSAVGDPEAIGIADPFLSKSVQKGDRFWLYLYPRSITSLRHNWTHPAFPDQPGAGVYATPAQKLESQGWISDFAGSWHKSAAEIIERAEDWLDHKEYWNDGGTFEGESVPQEFWDHYERVTGRQVPKLARESFFTCSC